MSETLEIQSLFRTYEVVFADDPRGFLAEHQERAFALVDSGILAAFPELLEDFSADRIIEIEATEHAKDIENVVDVIEILVEKGLRRGDELVAVGGGVVQDITAFAASIIYRGVDWVYVPTTLAAQADSCIGSKTSINLRGYKNLLGNFNPPTVVLNCSRFLETLPREEIKSGIGEILHFYLIDDSPLTEELMDEYEEVLEDRSRLPRYIAESLAIKKKTIEIDEFDKNERRVFNYGHTFGHALEAVSQYAVPHGQAVTRGMDIANYVSRELSHLSDEEFQSMREVLEPNIPDYLIPERALDDYMEALSRDKKNRGNDLGCILTRGRGDMFLTYIPLDDNLQEVIGRYFSEARELEASPA